MGEDTDLGVSVQRDVMQHRRVPLETETSKLKSLSSENSPVVPQFPLQVKELPSSIQLPVPLLQHCQTPTQGGQFWVSHSQ